MTTTPKALRSRNMTAAKKAAALIRDGILTHLEILAEGKVPESSLAAPVAKYETALGNLRLLDALGGVGPDDGTGEVRLDDLGTFVQLVHQLLPGTDALQADSPLGRLAAVAYPGGLPAPAGPEQED